MGFEWDPIDLSAVLLSILEAIRLGNQFLEQKGPNNTDLASNLNLMTIWRIEI